MIKILAIGGWVVAVALGATYFSVNMSMAPEVDPEAARVANLETIRGDVTSLPVIKDGRVAGYFLTRLSYVGDKVKLAEVHMPITALITDELFTALVGNQILDVEHNSNFDLDAFRNGIKDKINEKLGEDIIEDVLVEQIDYLSKDDIRSNIAQKNLNMQTGQTLLQGEVHEDGAASASEGNTGH